MENITEQEYSDYNKGYRDILKETTPKDTKEKKERKYSGSGKGFYISEKVNKAIKDYMEKHGSSPIEIERKSRYELFTPEELKEQDEELERIKQERLKRAKDYE